MTPPTVVTGVAGDEEVRILIRDEVVRSFPLAVVIRCAKLAVKRRGNPPINDAWEESPVTDIDGQSVTLVLCVLEVEGRRVYAVNKARYTKRKGW